MSPTDLLQLAMMARDHAYAPYSTFEVGAALLTKSGEVFSGCNVENASYRLTLCAERVAIAKAVSEGITRFSALAISSHGAAFPCGACRQFINEFNPNLPIIIGDDSGHLIQETTLDTLLPNAFGPANLHSNT